jgi:hypothetical protein
MRGEKKSAIEVQGTSIPFLSQQMGILIPQNSRELEMRRDGMNTFREGVF